MAHQPTRNLPALTGLRFFAAAFVVVFHYGRDLLGGAPAWLQNIASGGYIGVSLFFVLSGFVMAYTYGAEAERGTLSRRAFWVARIARVYPVYLLAVAISFPPFLANAADVSGRAHVVGQALLALVTNLTMTQAWNAHTAIMVNVPAWSLSVEAFFYLVFPLLAAPLLRLDGRRAVAALLAIWVLGMLVPLGYVLTRPDGLLTAQGVDTLAATEVGNQPFWLLTVKYTPLLHLHEFLIGMLTARLFVSASRRGLPNGDTWRQLAVLAPPLALLGTFGVLALGNRAIYPLVHDGLLAPLFALLIFSLALGGPGMGWFFSRPALVLLGEASYSIYILQIPVMTYVRVGILYLMTGHIQRNQEQAFNSSLWFLGLYALILVGGSIATLYLIEKPGRQFLRAALPSARPPVAAAA